MVKKTFKSLLTAFLYFLIYSGSQTAVAYACIFIEILFSVTVGVMEMTIAAGILTLALYFIIFRFRGKNLFSEIGLVRIPVPSCLLMLVLGASLNIAVIFILVLIPFPEEWFSQYSEMASLITDSAIWLQILATVIVAPVVEEIVFRGLIHTTLKRVMPMFAAMVVSAWVFGTMHGALIWVIYAGILGFVLAWVYEKYKSLLACICLHLGFNLCGILLDMLEEPPIMPMLCSPLIALVVIIYVQLKSKNKITFTMPAPQIEQNDGEM